MSADSAGPGQHPENPQSWNMYTYVMNNPLKLVDPSGQFTCASSVSDQQCDNFQALLDQAQAAADVLGETVGWDSKQYIDAQRAIDAFGDEGVDNGVTIAQGNTGSYAATTKVGGNRSAPTRINPNGQNILVTYSSSSQWLDSSNNAWVASSIAHEGVHVADGSDWVSSGFSASANPSRLQTESDAYTVQGNILRALGSPQYSFGHGSANFQFSSPPDVRRAPAGAETWLMLKASYPNLENDAFSRNTRVNRSQ